MKPVPSAIQYTFPPIAYPDGRKSICKLPQGYSQSALHADDYRELSHEYGIEFGLIQAVISVESDGSGFLLNEPNPARPKILFEASVFYWETPKPVSQTRPDLSSRNWDRSLYKGGSAEWGRLLDAMSFDEIAALKSASYGLGQVMGKNYQLAGCTSIQQLVQENFAGEYWQARHMLNYIVNTHLLSALKERNWDGFAYGYNGSGYEENHYAERLAAAYEAALVTA